MKATSPTTAVTQDVYSPNKKRLSDSPNHEQMSRSSSNRIHLQVEMKQRKSEYFRTNLLQTILSL